MPVEKRPFVNVDELLPQITLEQAANFYGVQLPDLKRIGSETRAACFLICGKTQETGDRALAIQCDDPAKKWKCHQYGCQKGGNLVSLCDLMKPGPNAAGRPRGDRFKEIVQDLQAMIRGEMSSTTAPVQATPKPPTTAEPRVNMPLKDSENERARALVHLDKKFVVDPANMSPSASSYFRRRPFLTPDVCQACAWGICPRNVGGENKTGGSLRGRIAYAYLAEDGGELCFFGRDPEFEDKHKKWEGGDKSEKEPEKFHFVKGFHRGLELFGQHQLRAEGVKEKLQGLGLVLVEGPNDVIRLATLGVPAVALCSNSITRDQAAKAAQLARECADGVVTVLLDCDEPGHAGMRNCLGYLAPLVPVRLGWMDKMFGGKFKGRQPESLSEEEWMELRDYLVTGKADGWSLA